MPEENPYRYEGSAESLAKPKERVRATAAASGGFLFCISLAAALAAAILVPLFDNPILIPFSLGLTVFVLLPIGIFLGILSKKRSLWKALLGFWITAIPETLILMTLVATYGFPGDAIYFLIGFGSQLIAAFLALICFPQA